jgi:hypothetical protein
LSRRGKEKREITADCAEKTPKEREKTCMTRMSVDERTKKEKRRITADCAEKTPKEREKTCMRRMKKRG